MSPAIVPRDARNAVIPVAGRMVPLTDLGRPYWPDLGITKGDLLAYYAGISAMLLGHLRGRPVLMKRYPDGAAGVGSVLRDAPSARPAWISTCRIPAGPGEARELALVEDEAALLWLLDIGGIDLEPWFDLGEAERQPLRLEVVPARGTPFSSVRETALRLRDALRNRAMEPYVKTAGEGLDVWISADSAWSTRPAELGADLAREAGAAGASVEVRVAPPASTAPYSVLPTPEAAVSTPIGWDELETGAMPAGFRIDTLLARVMRVGDLWAPLLPPPRRAPSLASRALDRGSPRPVPGDPRGAGIPRRHDR